MNLAELQREAHAIAKDHGWWNEERTFGDLIALVHSKLSEALEAYRDEVLPSKPHLLSTKVASELADVVIRVADMVEGYGVDGGVMDRQLANQREVIPDLPPDFTFGERITALHN